jgi:ADP-heptose:LPS heptosyltransferase
MAVAIQVPLWVATALWLARIPIRRGVASKWYSWVFFNQAIRQKRSLAEKSEAQYNIDLLQIKNRPLEEPIKPVRILPNEIRVQEWKQKIGESFVLIHPGMAGSARNWPALNYKKLAEILLKNKMKVVVSGSKGDLNFIHSTNLLNTPGVISIVERTPPEDLLAVISLASVVVAPSTGVAHLGASLNKKVIGIYSPVRVQRPQRWGPLGDKARTFIPDLKGELCPGQTSCLGARCKLFDCMEEISVDRIANAVLG